MTRLIWDASGSRYFEDGLDRAVLYVHPDKVLVSGSNTMGLGSKTFSISLIPTLFPVGSTVKIEPYPDQTPYGLPEGMTGLVTASTLTSVTVNVTSIFSGSGTSSSSWVIQRLDIASAWSGIISVEEDAPSPATAQFLDGRPYLFIPSPREYTARIKAITYPDVFDKAQGVLEPISGFSLDSQPADSFDFCYRTLIGNDVNGISHGYKLHLVYNAIVAPDSVSYVVPTNQITPIEFGWNVQAIPTPVDGFRATAHIVIDTRRINPADLTTIENWLYGTASTYPRMPPALDVFELLYYNGIVITDLGDGTWRADGPRDQIYMISADGQFQIDGVTATINGDGTYTISSTP